MASPIQLVRDALLAATTVFDLVGDKIGPLQMVAGEQPPYIVLTVTSEEPQNLVVGGPPPITRCLVQVNAWGLSYADAERLSDLCRDALPIAGYLYMSLAANEFDFQQDTGLYSHGRIYQVWT